MSKVFAKTIGILALSAATASTAVAGEWTAVARFGVDVGRSTKSVVAAAPEIDPAGALSGVTLLLGGLAVMRGRRAKK